MNSFRIFISSPGDVVEEREKTKQVIAALQGEMGSEVSLVPVLWEDFPIPATASFQEGIDLVLAEQHRVDIAVFILWSRLGSPLGAVITKQDGSSYRSGTEREFDLMLAAYEQSGRKRPVMLVYTRKDDNGFNDRLDARKYGKDELFEIIEQLELVKQFISERFQDRDGHNIRAYHSYREPIGFAQRLQVHLRGAVTDLLGLESSITTWSEAPYRSLEAFDIEHAPIFFGRDEETCDLLQRLRDQEREGCAFACIVGASGSGKSSLARAGIAATLLQRSFDDGVKEWRVAVLLPSLGSGDLYFFLTRVLSERLPELGNGIGGLERFSKSLEDGNDVAISILLETAFKSADGLIGGELRILLVIDQLEELWTDRRITPDQRETFLHAIEHLARSRRLSVLATLRSDFYPQAQLSETFLRMKGNRGHFDLAPPGMAALQELIVQPAKRAGLRFERGSRNRRSLDQHILEDAARDSSALPMLQFALAELYERRDEQRQLTFAAYEAMGGVEGALGRRATQTFDSLPEDAREALDELLPMLVSVDIAGEQNVVRRRAPLVDLNTTPARRMLTERLIQTRFLTTDEDKQNGAAIVTFAHEALLRCWDRITLWIDNNRDLLRMRARVDHFQAMWNESGRDPSRLLPAGLPVNEGRRLLEATNQVLDENARQFVRSSLAHYEEGQRRIARNRRLAFIALSVLTLLATASGIIAWHMKGAAEKERAVAKEESAKRGRQLDEAALSDRFVAQEKLADGDESAALAHLERALRYVPTSSLPAEESLPILLSSSTEFSQMVLSGHEGRVRTAVFSADGVHVLTASDDETARLWDAESGAGEVEFKGHEGRVQLAAFSPDERRIVTASDDLTARIWDARSGASLVELKGHTAPLKSASFSPCGRLVVTGADDNSARLWDAETGQCLFALEKHKGIVWNAVFSPDGRRVVTASGDHLAQVWDVETGTPMVELKGHTDTVRNVAYSPDGTKILTCSWDRTARLWDAASGEILKVFEGHRNDIRTVQFSPDGRRVLTASWDRTARIWDVATGASLVEITGHSATVWTAAFSPDGLRVITSSEDGSARLWDARTGAILAVYKGHSRDVRSAGFSPDGQRVVTGSADGSARLWAAKGGASFAEFQGHTDIVSGAVFSTDQRSVLTASLDHTARVWSCENGATLVTLKGHTGEIESAVFRADSKQILTASKDQTARLWSSETGQVVVEFKGHSSGVNKAVFSPDGQRVLTASEDSTARVWDARSGESLFECIGHTDSLVDAFYSPDGKWILTVSWDNTARLWDAATGAFLKRFRGHGEPATSAAFSPDGRRIVTGSKDQTARLWDVGSGETIRIFKGHRGAVLSVRFSPDGRRILAASADQTASLWDTESGRNLATFGGHSGSVTSALFSPDGDTVLTASDDRTARLWEAESGTLLHEFRGHALGIVCVAFTTDGSRIVTSSIDHTARLWEASTGMLLMAFNGRVCKASTTFPGARGSQSGIAPPWFGEFLLTIAGQRLGENGRLQLYPNVSGPAWSEALLRASRQSEETEYLRFLRWCMKPVSDRPVDPYDETMRVAEASRIIAEGTNRDAIEHAYRLDPSNPLVHLALANFEEDPGSADFLRQYTLDRLPEDPALLMRAAEMLNQQGQFALALGQVNRLLEIMPENHAGNDLRTKLRIAIGEAR